ncbi:transcription factor Spi-C isoform X1 [Heteronotia binoei]|uniref:transcription factor Spi-C isoform X1 n=2 Tax=Heteronotia binoei TaxID=13085 RepID=UPI00292EED27|nr:transcription factor Spi-C isoform X1 [Heteronotia binoei]XP_060101623.1 transcription factor Spi-C isoform X1 [Heteronotia binoei]XP_060101624.1 transcription factor Spi-C isoform X1 [Heteronotia binoei]
MSFMDQDVFGQALEDALEVLQQESSSDFGYEPDYSNCLTYHHLHIRTNSSHLTESFTEKPFYSWKNTIDFEANLYPDCTVYQALQTVPETQEICSTTPLQLKGGKGRKKLRLFEYLHESLHNPDTANCIQWIDKPNGVFQFISKNKEKLAELWGERKGNRKIMTYQKMARALRNYGKTGEIVKIRRKLTYQFGPMVLQRLSPASFLEKDAEVGQYAHPDQGCHYVDDCLSYDYYSCNNGHELHQ